MYRETIGRKICSMERRENRKEQLSLLTVEEEEGLPPLLWLESPDLKHRDILFVAIPLALGNMKNFLNHFLLVRIGHDESIRNLLPASPIGTAGYSAYPGGAANCWTYPWRRRKGLSWMIFSSLPRI